MKRISMTINEYRKALGMTVIEIMESLEISLSTYKRISNGTRELKTIERDWLERKLPGSKKKGLK